MWGEVMNKQIHLSNNKSIYFATIVDITERKSKECKIKEVNDKLNIVLKGTNTGLWEWDVVTNKVHYNKEWGEQLGYGYDELDQDFDTWQKFTYKCVSKTFPAGVGEQVLKSSHGKAHYSVDKT